MLPRRPSQLTTVVYETGKMASRDDTRVRVCRTRMRGRDRLEASVADSDNDVNQDHHSSHDPRRLPGLKRVRRYEDDD